MVHPERIRALNSRQENRRGECVLYWMQASQRTRDNHALEYAVAVCKGQTILPDDLHCPRTRLVVIENTHNRGGGTFYPVRTVCEIGQLCRQRGIVLHMDGARLLNACVAEGVEATAYTEHVDSVTLCFSKGLGCPVGCRSLRGGCRLPHCGAGLLLPAVGRRL